MNAPFLDPAEIRHNCAEAGLDDTSTQAFVAFADHITTDSSLTTHAIAAHHCLYETSDDCADTIRQAEAAFGDDIRILRGLLVLDSIRLIRTKQGARGVPVEITHAILESHPCPTLRDYVKQNGRVGADAWIWDWYRTVGSGHLYGLGRLEFFHEAWDYPWRVWINDATSEVIVLLNPGLCFTDDGYMTSQTTWTTKLVETEDAIVGHAVSPTGAAIRIPVRLPRTHWRVALGPGNFVLDMHVPGDIPLTLDLIRDALQQSESFFDHFYPNQIFTAWVCDSWLFCPQMEQMLPPESNIVRWQREGYLLPNDSDGSDLMSFVFGKSTIDPATAPRDTRLRRAILARLAQGEPMRCGGYLLLRKDLTRFGTQPYRTSSEQAIARLTLTK